MKKKLKTENNKSHSFMLTGIIDFNAILKELFHFLELKRIKIMRKYIFYFIYVEVCPLFSCQLNDFILL